MASSVIHMCVASEINKILNRNNKSILIGSIAPDISKQIGENKIISHFQDKDDNLPNLDKFIAKYKKYMNNDFVLGYYIHLYTDYLWFKYFIPDFILNDNIYFLDGRILKLSDEEKINYFYNDYTNLNINLISDYNLDLSIFYEQIPNIKNIISEIPIDKINIIIDKMGSIIENSKSSKPYIFDENIVNKFIITSVNYILSKLEEEKIVS